jgi:4-hydroxythreonine-4-phosphate dehydrogenase
MNRSMPVIALTPGEPAGIGPDICLALAGRELPARLLAFADRDMLDDRARRLGLTVHLEQAEGELPPHRPGTLLVHHIPLAVPTVCGEPDPANAAALLATLDAAVSACQSGSCEAMVTGPLQKSVINDAGIPFSGHTEYLAARTGSELPVMMLAAGELRVALATTHLPLRAVPDAITRPRLERVIETLHRELGQRFGIARPRILVCGLNPHAGEAGHLGREEIEIIGPALEALRGRGMDLAGPLPADTLFTPRHLEGADAVLAMYHDQGLPVLKYAGFGKAVNITLGLPLIRTSVDHGTALDLAGSGRADAGSLYEAVVCAARMVGAPER